ncbi:MAG TPA: ATP-binding protein [Bacteroidales bacterium]|nr:ATP-binding protein [Bacteroidales bacterium]HNS45955.1 ATP-binding protein [Bacteroidales bacterium]
MHINASHRKGILRAFGISLAFLFIAVAANLVLVNRLDPVRQSKYLEKKLSLKEQALVSTIEKIRTCSNTPRSDRNTVWSDLYRRCDKEGIIVLMYHRDTLKLWTSSTLPHDSLSLPPEIHQPVLLLRNGWYLVRKMTTADTTYAGLFQIKNRFPYQNEYLVNTFGKGIHLSSNILISNKITDYPIYGTDGSYLFSLVFPESPSLPDVQNYLLFLLYFLFLLFFVLGIFRTYGWIEKKMKIRPSLLFLAFTTDVLITRILIFYFKIPHTLYQSDLFKPLYYGSSFLLPSLGDLVVNTLLLLFVSYAFFVLARPTLRATRVRVPLRYILSLVCFLTIFLLMDVVLYLIKGLILDSNFSLNLNNIFGMTFSSLLGFSVITSLLICFFLAAWTLFAWIYLYLPSLKHHVLFLILSGVLYFGIGSLTGFSPDAAFAGFMVIFMLSLWVVRKRHIPLLSFYNAVYFLFLFAAFTTYVLNTYHHKKEREQRKWMAIKLSIERDQITEYLFADTEKKMKGDSLLEAQIFTALADDSIEQMILQYIGDRYLEPYRDNYNYQITVCDEKQVLRVQPENYDVSCLEFFSDMIQRIGKPTAATTLYFLDDGTDDINYVSRIPFVSPAGTDSLGLFIELYSKYIPKALGYPELLIDKKTTAFTDLTNHSYAIYNNQALTKSVGKYFYPIDENSLGHTTDEFTFFNRDGYNHLHYRAGPGRDIIVSTQRDTLWGLLAPFAYLIIFYGVVLLILVLVLSPSLRIRMSAPSFKDRLQLAVIAIILVSFLFIGITSLLYLADLNTKKNLDILSEKTHSVLIELEHKLSSEPSLPPAMSSYLTELLNKFSQVFFSDINLYDTGGRLLASSRHEIFEEGLQSNLMNPMAFDQMVIQNKTIFIQRERIGRYEFLSAYVPFQNNDNKTIAYVNLPYFARQSELRQEISMFLTAFANINVILIALATFVALIVSNYITRPMQLIREKMGKLKLGKTNEKIEWSGKDEIGNLVEEYNRMIGELANSADLLARSERESAWREMAKQVAHEIKNPLTPMKLSIQYLQKAWDEKAPDWDLRLKRFTETLIEQIENLSLIATEFSDFAKMPQPLLERMDLKEVIQSAVSLFEDIQHIEFIASDMPDEPCWIWADRKQMLRVFNNLIKNSVQAIPVHQQGVVEISAHKEASDVVVHIRDTGIGIPSDQIPRIFTPSFTTKTGGMGMGLAIVKSIIVNTQGDIWFESREGKGTVFSFRLPLLQEKR